MFHSIDICIDIAQKLKDPSITLDIIRRNAKQIGADSWGYTSPIPTSLAWGASGIACFYAMMNCHFEREGWDQVAHNYLELVGQTLESTPCQNISLFAGLAGFAFATYLCSIKGIRYKQLLARLDHVLIKEIKEQFLTPLRNSCQSQDPVLPKLYDLADGLSGALVYLINRSDDEELTRLTHSSLECLVKSLSVPKFIDQQGVQPWYVPSSSTQSSVVEGGYSTKVPFGIIGVLGVLALAMKKKICVPGQKELVITLSNWVREQQIVTKDFAAGHSTILLENNGWLIGSPGIARCLYLASEALQDLELAEFAEKLLLASLKKAAQLKPDLDVSFNCGQAGLLTITHKMACDIKKPIFFRFTQDIENQINHFYNTSHSFGFRTLVKEKDGKSNWIDNPDLFSGASGIAMALLSAQGRSEATWSHAFVI